MPIEVRKALEILSEILAGEKTKRFFLQKSIARDGLQMEPSELSHKLGGRRKFTYADYVRLAEYFELGEKGHALFQAKDEDEFRERLRILGVGKYTSNSTRSLLQKLVTAANQSSATLKLIDCYSTLKNRSGLVSPENVVRKKGITLRIGDKVRLRFSFPSKEQNSLWFSLINIHIYSDRVRILNPIFKESEIQLHFSHLDFPESQGLEITDASMVGPHRLIAIAGTLDFHSTLLDETGRLLNLCNGTDLWIDDNQFDGLLDKIAIENINRASQSGIVHCAILDYRQVQGAQQP